MTYEAKAEVMLKEYSSDARKLRVRGTLETLPLNSFIGTNNMNDASEGLTKLVDLIKELSPQCPPAFRDDAHKIDYLTKAVTASEFICWSDAPIKSVVTLGLSFNGFVTALHESLQRKRQIDMPTKESDKCRVSMLTCFVSDNEDIETNQKRYGRDPRQLQLQNTTRGPNRQNLAPSKPPRPHNTHQTPHRGNECHKCGYPTWHRGQKCDPKAISAYAHQHLKNGESSVHVLADFMKAEENSFKEEEEGPSPSQERDTFVMENKELTGFRLLHGLRLRGS